jgi:NTE family protein
VGVCLVLGGGGARGIAHVGAIRVLVENNIPIDHIIGTSAGAMIGGLFAYNPDIDWLEDFVISTEKKDMVRREWGTFKGYSNGRAFLKHMNKYIHNAEFNDLKIPFSAIAADVDTGELVAIEEGNVAMAQLCSCALPPIYAPQRHMGRYLFDGGCVQSVPSDYAKTVMPADKPVVAIQVGINMPSKKLKTYHSVMLRFVQIRTVYFDSYCEQSADVVIRPGIPGLNILNDSDKDSYMQKGQEAALAQLDNIKALLNP